MQTKSGKRVQSFIRFTFSFFFYELHHVPKYSHKTAQLRQSGVLLDLYVPRLCSSRVSVLHGHLHGGEAVFLDGSCALSSSL